jgi:predicted phage terminase large subunit-like protein
MRDNLKRRRLIQSPWYQEHWGEVFKITSDQNAKTRFENNHNGHCLITSPDSAATGEGGDVIIVDDPHNVTEARSEAARANVITWWDESMSTRLNNPAMGVRGMIAQRVHELDLCGHCLETGTYAHLCLPARYEPQHPHLSEVDWRTEPGELLWPAQFGEKQLSKLETSLGSYGAAGQLQQRPAPASGGVIQRVWIQYWDKLPDNFDGACQSWDMAFKDTQKGSYVVGQVWARKGADCYLLDQYRAQADFPVTIKAVKDMTSRWPWVTTKLVEDKANGPAVIAQLKREVTGLIPVSVVGNKEARLAAAAPAFEAGNVWLPRTHWIADYVEELCSFPNAANDDQADSTSQAIERLLVAPVTGTAATVGERTILQTYKPR